MRYDFMMCPTICSCYFQRHFTSFPLIMNAECLCSYNNSLALQELHPDIFSRARSSDSDEPLLQCFTLFD